MSFTNNVLVVQISSGFGNEEPVPSLVRELIIALSSMGDNLRDSVKRYAFITARTLRTPDHNTLNYYRLYTELYTEMEDGVIVT